MPSTTILRGDALSNAGVHPSVCKCPYITLRGNPILEVKRISHHGCVAIRSCQIVTEAESVVKILKNKQDRVMAIIKCE